METGLEGRPWYFGAILGVGVGVGLCVLGYTFQIKDMRVQFEEAGKQLQELEDKVARGQAAKARLPQFERQVALLESELDKLLQILPPRRDVPDVLRRFRALAEQGDFVLSSVKPGIEVEKEFYNEWPISFEVQGTYHNLARFFDRMSRFSRIFNVANLKIDEKREGQHSITASFVAKTFVYKESAEEGS